MSKEDLSQMGVAKAYLTMYRGTQCICKVGATAVEVGFYQQMAPKLRQAGVGIPALINVENSNLYIEYIPRKVKDSDLVDNQEVLRQLSIIHNCRMPNGSVRKRHTWTQLETVSAMSFLSLPSSLQQLFQHMSSSSNELFDSDYMISGDTNSGNWGIRGNGEWVLYDWERFSQANPAIDLAPLVKGMGSIEQYQSITQLYLTQNKGWEGECLIKSLILAKGWIVVEVDFDVILASLIENEATNSDLYFDYLVSRQTVSLELITHWLDSAKLPSHKLLPILALSNKKRGKVWLDQNYEKHDLIFEKLVVTHEAKNFLCNRIRDEEEHEETSLSTYFAFWPRAELMVSDMSKPRSYLPLILLGDTNCIPDAIEHMESSTEKDKWLQALYVMYGAALPIQPKDYIDEPVWDEVFGILYQWIDSGLYLCDKPIRLNRQLNFESSLMVLRDPYIDCDLREWVWRQLCVRSRMYFYWHPLLPKSQQDKVFSSLVDSGVGQDRFDLAEV